jgi:limonene-1,2-epoxide hydrolase
MREDATLASNCDRVRDFIGAWEARDIEGILKRMTSDATYLNVGLSEAKGHEAIRATIAPFLLTASAVRWKIVHIAETADGVVLTERVDVFEMGDKTLSVPVMGAFEFQGDLISAWRDYFDLPGFQSQMS